jgi:hypothetical protein
MLKLFKIDYQIDIYTNEEMITINKTHFLIRDSVEEVKTHIQNYIKEFNNGLSEKEAYDIYGYNISEEYYLQEIDEIDGHKIKIEE